MKPSQNSTLKTAQENQEYYDGQHWKHWIGPRIPSSELKAVELMAEVERVFQSLNLIKECCDRHASALVGKFPHWYLKGADGKRISTKNDQGEALDTPAAQAEIQLQRWLDKVLQRADTGATDQGDPFWNSISSLTVTGYGALRLWQPDRFAEAEDPLDRIHLHAPVVGSVEEGRGDDGFLEKLTYSYGNSKKEIEELNENGELVVTTTTAGADGGDSITIDTGGRWTISQMRSASLITPQIKQLQNGVNHSLTMLLRNQEQGGFLQRIFLNAQPPGEWVEDPKTGQQKFVPAGDGLESGPGRDTFLFGIPNGDPSTPSYTTPSVVIRDPVTPETFLKAIGAYREFVYHSFGQGHLLATGDGTMSGISRIQIRQDFEVLLTRQKRVIEAAIANILNVVLKILGYSDLEAVVQLRISTGKLSPEERTEIMTEHDKGLLSKTTTIALLGTVDDPDAELALIAEEEAEEMAARPLPVIELPIVGGNRNQPTKESEDGTDRRDTDPTPVAA